MLLSEMAAMRIWSKDRVRKAAKVLQKGTVLLRVAQPTATLTWRQAGRVELASAGAQQVKLWPLGCRVLVLAALLLNPAPR